MKVFISHSSSDKWIARQIAVHLGERGVECFLDEKDIETGDIIDDSIQKNLNECDELLMLLSPAALESAWVLLEIGGAKVLGKRLVPILVHVGANDLPDPLSTGLARDLNDIDSYYREVEERAAKPAKAGRAAKAPQDPNGDAAPKKARKRSKASSKSTQSAALKKRAGRAVARPPKKLKEGDRVRLPAVRPKSTYDRAGTDVGWNGEMDQYLDRVSTIDLVTETGRILLDIDDGEWVWLMDWLEPEPDSGTAAEG